MLAKDTGNLAFPNQNSKMPSPLHLGVVFNRAGCSEGGLCSSRLVCIAASQQTSLLACKQLSRHYTSKE